MQNDQTLITLLTIDSRAAQTGGLNRPPITAVRTFSQKRSVGRPVAFSNFSNSMILRRRRPPTTLMFKCVY